MVFMFIILLFLQTDILLVVKPGQNEVWRVNKDSFVQNVREMISRKQTASSNVSYVGKGILIAGLTPEKSRAVMHRDMPTFN